jgi:hypothetical protein
MNRIHDPAVRDSLKVRIAKLTPAAARKWGKMTPDQMLWHCSEALEAAMGMKPYREMPPMPPLPKSWIRWLLLNGPWLKGRTPTAPQFVAKERYDLEKERARLLALVDQLGAKDPTTKAAPHPLLGDVTIEYQSRLHARHLNHHLEQFGV